MKKRILLVEDDAALGRVTEVMLRSNGYEVRHVTDGRVALAELSRAAWDLVLTDVRMPAMDGLELLDRVQSNYPDTPVVLLTAHASVGAAVDAMKRGARDYVAKPVAKEELLHVIELALQSAEAALPRSAQAPSSVAPMGLAAAMQEVDTLISRVASNDTSVLILGETGTGKEVTAKLIHARSKRSQEPFIAVNLAALPESLLEAELFGHEKGAFTGAAQSKPGRLELAHGGTLFLDEIGEVPLPTQVKLLRFLQEQTVERVGGTTSRKLDVRVIAATHRDLAAAVSTGTFREDFYYRLAVIPIRLPPLRERESDVELLARLFFDRFAQKHGRTNLALTEAAVAELRAYPWPGNVRELEHTMERLVVLADASPVQGNCVKRALSLSLSPRFPDAPTSSTPPPIDGTLADRRRAADRTAVEDALLRAKGNRTMAARLLGVSRRTLYNKLEELGIRSGD
ncbi:MAG: sigma-54 dependent transcriptional regulator [Polyangiaceae bacterium]